MTVLAGCEMLDLACLLRARASYHQQFFGFLSNGWNRRCFGSLYLKREELFSLSSLNLEVGQASHRAPPALPVVWNILAEVGMVSVGRHV